MKIWCSNTVQIQAPLIEVQKYIVANDDRPYFNMAMLFPEMFGPEDAAGLIAWTEGWSCSNTGTKWFPDIGFIGHRKDDTLLKYQTARWPNTKTLNRLHELTGWTIVNKFKHTEMAHKGSFRCHGGECTKTIRHFISPCEVCGKMKFEAGHDIWDRVC